MITQIDKENLLYPLPELDLNNVFIAGGALRSSLLNERYSDIDIFSTENKHLDEFLATLLDWDLVYDAEKLKTLKKGNDKIQLIYREYESIESCLNSFDFTICQFAMNNEGLYCNPESLIHLFRKKLVVHKINPEWAYDTLRRMQKYIKAGFTICDGGLVDIVNAIREASDEQIENGFSLYPDGTKRIIRFD